MEELLTDYKNLPVADLVRIAEYPKIHKPGAVLAAKREIQRRQISQKEIDEIRNYLNEGWAAVEPESISTYHKIERLLNKKLNPGAAKLTYPEKVVRWVTIILSVFAGSHILLLVMVLGLNGEPFNLSTGIFTSLLLLITITVLWHSKSKIGWAMVVMYLSCHVYGQISMLALSSSSQYSDASSSVVLRIIFILPYLAVIYTLNTRQLRHFFNVSKIELAGIHVTAFTLFLLITQFLTWL
ncbi:hypothetical protein AB9P05_22265 [Roseivirga sp. BDSF3-8]|uniref:hypothetical protein n=1 Tax=Roseivirga sp. BDSF3-8 TaxID=3241598 RepID=UPI0035319242